MSRLEAERDYVGLILVYRQSSQLAAIFAASASITIGLLAEPLLWAWTGDRFLARQAAPILLLYSFGNGLLVLAAFPYYLQYAKGDLRLHFIGHAAFVVLLLPASVWGAYHYGGVGAGYVWLCMTSLLFGGWLPFVHRRFVPGLNRKWYGQDVLPTVAAAAIAGYSVRAVISETGARWTELLQVVAAGTFVALVSAAASSEVRTRLITKLH
jgi:O-antigen/teichoic acid export membrane protein